MDPLATALEPLGIFRAPGPAAPSDQPDFVSGDGAVWVEVKASSGGARDLRAGLVQLALWVQGRPDTRGVLLLLHPRMSADGVRAEWGRVLAVLEPSVACRLGVVVVSTGEALVLPDEPAWRALGVRAAAAVGGRPPLPRPDRSHDVLRVLVSRWLRGEGPIAIGALGRVVGQSHPSVSKALAALGEAVERRTDRSVGLRALPRARWAQLLALAPGVRRSAAFVDGSGRGARPLDLLARLQRQRPAGVALGGVVAARFWHPELDLDGLPRLDLTVHAPDGRAALEFVHALDPALVPAPAEAPPALVVHTLGRASSLFVPAPDGGLPFADPAEVLLDLQGLRLSAQADAFIRHLRGAW